MDSGHEDEITSVPVAAQQVEVFTKVLMTTIQRTIDSEPDEWKRNIQELVVCSDTNDCFELVDSFVSAIGVP